MNFALFPCLCLCTSRLRVTRPSTTYASSEAFSIPVHSYLLQAVILFFGWDFASSTSLPTSATEVTPVRWITLHYVLILTFVLSYSQQQLYDVVADVDAYELFVPYCLRSRILKRFTESKDGLDLEMMEAELEIGSALFKHSYVSRVMCTPFTSVEVSSDIRVLGWYSHLFLLPLGRWNNVYPTL
jgi:hypothetical protein